MEAVMVKTILFLALLFFPLTGCYSEEPAAKTAETPDANAWDFGQVVERQMVSHDFILKNESANTMAIKNVTTSCGCTASKADKDVLAPGDSAKIKVSFNSSGYSGKVKQFVYVHTDILDKSIIRFIITADVVKEK
jgi:hypothetical protein